MNAWFRDERCKRAQSASIEAEDIERSGDIEAARTIYRAAADDFAAVALEVPADHPNTRTDLAIAAVACFARSRAFDQAVDVAQRFLAEPDALTTDGRAELSQMIDDYAPLAVRKRFPAKRAKERRVRNDVRFRFERAA